MTAMPSSAVPLDRRLAIRAALTMAAVLAPVFLVLALTLPKSFFEDWGWLAGPGAWIAAALVAGRVCRLAPGPVLAGALVSGLVSLAFVLADLHDVGPLLSLPLFGYWCGRIARSDRIAPAASSA